MSYFFKHLHWFAQTGLDCTLTLSLLMSLCLSVVCIFFADKHVCVNLCVLLYLKMSVFALSVCLTVCVCGFVVPVYLEGPLSSCLRAGT